MTAGIDEQLSAFLDGELSAGEEELLLRRLDRDAGHRQRLARFAAMGQVMRGHAPAVNAVHLGERISVALAEETAHAGTAGSWGGLAIAGLAAAAGVVVLTGLLSLGSVSLDEPQQLAQVIQPTVQAAELQAAGTSPLGAARLTGYLVAHGDYAGGLSRQVVSSHVVNRSPDFIQASTRRGVFDE
ncbi:MAG: sigma-E factor negative regulatory protein [Gammaproteobacteria bacterium]